MDYFRTGVRAPLFFMHIPKTAGMSMRMYLGEQYHPHEICPAESWRDILGREKDVRSFRLVRGHFRYNMRGLVAEEARTLVVLREPLARTVSALRHLRRDQQFHPTWEIARDLSIAEMIRHPGIMAFQRDIQARFLCASIVPDAVTAHFTRTDRPDEADAGDLEEPPELQLAAERLETIDFVGVTENLNAVVSDMAREMNFHPPAYFPMINENPDHTNPLHGLTGEDLELVRSYNAVDLLLYEWARKLIDWRDFIRSMHHMVRSGVYRVPPDSFELRLSDIIPGSGWYEAEHEDETFWRWTGPDPRFTIEVPLRPDASYRFIMTFDDPRPSGPDRFGVELNDVPIQIELWPEDEGYRCEFIIEQAQLAGSSGFCRLRFETGEPIRLGLSDLRPLGVLVRRVEFICLET
jgi:hypothetical protein